MSAVTATAAAASATMPVVVVRSSTPREDKRPPAQTPHRVKSAGYSCRLLSVFFSPRTGATATVIVTGVPTGGRRVSGTLTVAVWPAVVCGTVLDAVIGRPAPAMRTLALTLCSSLSPWFWNLTVNDGGVVAGMRLTLPGCSVVGP